MQLLWLVLICRFLAVSKAVGTQTFNSAIGNAVTKQIMAFRMQNTENPYIEDVLEKYSSIPDLTLLALGSSYWGPPREALEKIFVEDMEIHKYGAIMGYSPLIQKITSRLVSNGLDMTTIDVAVTAGANQAFLNVALTLCDTGSTAGIYLLTPSKTLTYSFCFSYSRSLLLQPQTLFTIGGSSCQCVSFRCVDVVAAMGLVGIRDDRTHSPNGPTQINMTCWPWRQNIKFATSLLFTGSFDVSKQPLWQGLVKGRNCQVDGLVSSRGILACG